MNNTIQEHIKTAEVKAWDSLCRYKFQMFGYWAAIWVHLNKISGNKRPNPFRSLVKFARTNPERTCDLCGGDDPNCLDMTTGMTQDERAWLG